MTNIGIGLTEPQEFIHLYANGRDIATVNHAGDVVFSDDLSVEDLKEGLRVLLREVYVAGKEIPRSDLIIKADGNVGINL